MDRIAYLLIGLLLVPSITSAQQPEFSDANSRLLPRALDYLLLIGEERRDPGISGLDGMAVRQITYDGLVWRSRMAIAQGIYYTTTGIWPILHMRSFEKVTGPKEDDWLVKTVGAVLTVIGGTLLTAGIRGDPSNDLIAVASGNAVVLAGVDIIFVAQGRISHVYLLDAAAELALLGGWLYAVTR